MRFNTAEEITIQPADEFLQDVDESTDTVSESTDTVSESTDTEKKTRKKRINKDPKPYPFRSKKAIVDDVNSSDEFCLQCLAVLYSRQSASEQAKGTTEARNRQGFMSSHAVVGTKLAKKAASESLDTEEINQARGIVSRYGRQLAAHFRSEEIARDPAKAELAVLFSAS